MKNRNIGNKVRLHKTLIASLLCVASSAALSNEEQPLLTLSCTANDYLFVTVDINSGKLSSSTKNLSSTPFDVVVTHYDGVVRVHSPQYDFVSYFSNIYRYPERIKNIRYNETLAHGLVVEAKDIREYSTLDVSDYGLFLVDVSSSLKISRGIRTGGVAGFFTETFSGETRTLSFSCDNYSESEWRMLTKPVFNYILSNQKQDEK